MAVSTGERTLKALGLVALIALALGSLFVDSEAEIILFMAAAVIAALACFDAAMDRKTHSFWPWILVSVGVLAKTLPTVFSNLTSETGSALERSDHLGTVLAGLAIGFAAWPIARPRFQHDSRRAITAVLALAGICGGVAGGSVAFGGQGAFASRRSALVFESLGWAGVALLLAGAAIAAAGVRPVTPSIPPLIVGMAAVAALAALTASGRVYDVGWWALAFVPLAAGPLLFIPARLGQLDRRYRRSFVPPLVALLGAIFAGRTLLIAAFEDDTWRPGWLALAAIAAALLALGLWLYRQVAGHEVLDDDAAARAGVIEVISETGLEDGSVRMDPVELESTVPSSAFSDAAGVGVVPDLPVEPIAVPGAESASRRSDFDDWPVSARAPDHGAIVEPAGTIPPVVIPTAEADHSATATPPPGPATPAPVPATAAPAPPPFPAPATPPPGPATPAPVPTPATPPPGPATPAPATPAPVPPQHVDPTTGLLSGPGLQHVVLSTFGRPRQAGEVGLLMIVIRNAAEIEARHGRVALTQVISELATRLRISLPNASLSRFVSNAYAAVLEGPAGGPQQQQAQIHRCTQVLLRLLEPVNIHAGPVDVDVAASLAQCYEGEDPQAFVDRANTGLERAVATAEPSLVAMP